MELSPRKKPQFKRLILCLDGTWNNQDSNTSIFHISDLVADADPDGVPQLIYYELGVGTGMFDHVSGGVFGFGINQNIRDAYEWLMEKYEDGDQVYIFGFSRGAYTARTLGGLLAKLGLLRTGAPMTVTELWDAYTLIGRVDAPRKNWWESIFDKPPRPCRPLIELKWDDGTPRDAKDLNRTEKLLLEWSRRPDIYCMGLFDTVGALGWDALAIPWLRTRIAAFHDTNLNVLVRHGFHALAIDEQRPMFKCIPWRRFVPTGGAPPSEREKQQVIEQRWFVGAHSNIGGGYEDNPLALFPLCWMMERTAGIGLCYRRMLQRPKIADCVPLIRVEEVREEDRRTKKPYLRDSYAEFLNGILRPFPLRYHRPILAPPRQHPKGTDESLGEVIDKSVQLFRDADPDYRPKNVPQTPSSTVPVEQ